MMNIRWVTNKKNTFGDNKSAFEYRKQYAGNTLFWNIGVSSRVLARRARTVLFYPVKPHRWAMDYQLCTLLGYRITSDPSQPYDAAISRQAATFLKPEVLETLGVQVSKIINARAVDTSKHTSARSFAKVFGYELEIDPMSYHGPILVKSNLNATKDGRIVDGPLSNESIQQNYVYQKLIDSRCESSGLELNYRVPIIGNSIPCVVLLFSNESERFIADCRYAWFEKSANVFSAREIEKLLLLAHELHIDYGEFDVLRDRDGFIYVVDVNPEPGGATARALSDVDAKRFLQRYARSFGKLMSEWIINNPITE